MKFRLFVLTLSIISLFTISSYAEDEHNHNSKENAESHSDNDDHNHNKHSENDGHGHKKKKKEESHKGHGHDDHSENDDHAHDKQNEAEKHDHGSHDEHDGHGSGKAIGKGKAIEEIKEEKGFRLSKEAIKTLKLKLDTVDGASFKISKKTLVASKNTKGVYRFRAGFFKLLPAEITKELPDGYIVEVKGVDFGDQIVVDGVGLLRVTDVYSTDKSEYGHSH